MLLVRFVTKNYVYAVGSTLPVPEGYPVEPFIIRSMGFLTSNVEEKKEVEETVTASPDTDISDKENYNASTESAEPVEEDVDTDIVRLVCEPDMDAARLEPVEYVNSEGEVYIAFKNRETGEFEDSKVPFTSITEFESIKSYHEKAFQSAQDKLLMVIDISEDVRYEYLTTEDIYNGNGDNEPSTE